MEINIKLNDSTEEELITSSLMTQALGQVLAQTLGRKQGKTNEDEDSNVTDIRKGKKKKPTDSAKKGKKKGKKKKVTLEEFAELPLEAQIVYAEMVNEKKGFVGEAYLRIICKTFQSNQPKGAVTKIIKACGFKLLKEVDEESEIEIVNGIKEASEDVEPEEEEEEEYE